MEQGKGRLGGAKERERKGVIGKSKKASFFRIFFLKEIEIIFFLRRRSLSLYLSFSENPSSLSPSSLSEHAPGPPAAPSDPLVFCLPLALINPKLQASNHRRGSQHPSGAVVDRESIDRFRFSCCYCFCFCIPRGPRDDRPSETRRPGDPRRPQDARGRGAEGEEEWSGRGRKEERF